MVPFKHVHAAAEIVVDSRGINGVSTESLLSDLSCIQEASECPCWLINVVQDRSESTERECLVRVILWQVNFCDGSHVACNSELVLSTRLIDTAEAHFEEKLLFFSQAGLLLFLLCILLSWTGDALLNVELWWVFNPTPDRPGVFKRANCHLVVC